MRARCAVLAGAVLLVTGCASSTSTSTPASSAVGLAYERAVLSGQWSAVCAAETARLRGATVTHCVAANAPGPQADSAVPASPGGVAAVRVSVSVPVAAAGTHPAGLGLLVEHASSDGLVGRALRLVREDGRWRVDQVEDDITAGGDGQAVLAALDRE